MNGRTRRALLAERYGSIAAVERERITPRTRLLTAVPDEPWMGTGGPDTPQTQSTRRAALLRALRTPTTKRTT